MGQTRSKNTTTNKKKRKFVSKLFHAQTGPIWFQIGSYLLQLCGSDSLWSFDCFFLAPPTAWPKAQSQSFSNILTPPLQHNPGPGKKNPQPRLSSPARKKQQNNNPKPRTGGNGKNDGGNPALLPQRDTRKKRQSCKQISQCPTCRWFQCCQRLLEEGLGSRPESLTGCQNIEDSIKSKECPLLSDMD